jgi:hypothetical protein
MAELDDFEALCSQAQALVKECSLGYSNDETLRQVFARRADDLFKLRRVEALLTDGLRRFPLHPGLLERRGDVRALMFDENANALALDGADSDYALGIEVRPRDPWLRYERAMLTTPAPHY